jgi:hypothetical protein
VAAPARGWPAPSRTTPLCRTTRGVCAETSSATAITINTAHPASLNLMMLPPFHRTMTGHQTK